MQPAAFVTLYDMIIHILPKYFPKRLLDTLRSCFPRSVFTRVNYLCIEVGSN